jgi:hypothetical protein
MAFINVDLLNISITHQSNTETHGTTISCTHLFINGLILSY